MLWEGYGEGHTPTLTGVAPSLRVMLHARRACNKARELRAAEICMKRPRLAFMATPNSLRGARVERSKRARRRGSDPVAGRQSWDLDCVARHVRRHHPLLVVGFFTTRRVTARRLRIPGDRCNSNNDPHRWPSIYRTKAKTSTRRGVK
jgi:hypothetical protein